ncbi:MAG: sugar nucleotide-binding protein [Candidatus Omnitrophica bacterium]|nr:sugar nucleotide-binding protein [Candidatus Omnitrophota bacterium]
MCKMSLKETLLTGASGQLGSHIVQSGFFRNLLTPSHKELDICRANSISKYFQKHTVAGIIHCAAIARMKDCEKSPIEALETNIIGTCNLVKEILKNCPNKEIRFIHISTDGVYAGHKGRYTEQASAIPYNWYGWTKLGAECAVNLLQNFCIIRTRFFDPFNIPFDSYAVDSYTSSIPATDLANAIGLLFNSDFIGTINIGGKRLSDYARYKAFKPSIKPCRIEEIEKTIDFKISHDASLNSHLWKTLKK